MDADAEGRTRSTDWVGCGLSQQEPAGPWGPVLAPWYTAHTQYCQRQGYPEEPHMTTPLGIRWAHPNARWWHTEA